MSFWFNPLPSTARLSNLYPIVKNAQLFPWTWNIYTIPLITSRSSFPRWIFLLRRFFSTIKTFQVLLPVRKIQYFRNWIQFLRRCRARVRETMVALSNDKWERSVSYDVITNLCSLRKRTFNISRNFQLR